MNIIRKLMFEIRHMEVKKDYGLLQKFIDVNIDEITKLNDDELQLLIKYLMYATNGANFHWMNNKKVRNNKRLKNYIFEIAMKEDLYKVSSISYADVIYNLDIYTFPNDFCRYFLEKDLSSMDILLIASIMYNIDKNAYKEIMEKYKDTKYNPLEIDFQVSLIIDLKNYDFIKENKDLIFSLFQKEQLIELYRNIKDNTECRELLEEYIIDNLDKVINLKMSQVDSLLYEIKQGTKIYKALIKYLKDNMELIIKNQSDSLDLFDLKKTYETDDELKPLIRDYFDKNKNEIIDRMYKHITYLFIQYEDNQSEYNEERKTVKEILRLIIEELCEKEKVNFGEIEKIGEGAYSQVYKIKDKVIKLGIHRNTRLIPENPYIVKPLLRKNFSVDGKEFGEQLFIEVTERVDTLPVNLDPDKINEILYDLYSKQRDLGIEWKDIRIQNVGILRKDNIIHWPRELKSDCKQLGMIPNKTDIVLQKGDYVVLDADLQYTEEDFVKKHPKITEDVLRENFNNYWLEFHNRYNREHKRKVLKV